MVAVKSLIRHLPLGLQVLMDAAANLRYLDERFKQFDIPSLSNQNIDFVSLRLSAYVSGAGDWIVAFNSIVWWPAADGLMTLIELIGPGLSGRQGFDNDRHVRAGTIETDDSGMNVVGATVRGNRLSLQQLEITPDYDKHLEDGFWTCVALLPDYRESLLATEAEITQFIPAEFRKVFETDQWEHPDFNTPPSRTESFPKLAEALVSGDFRSLDQCARCNVNWSSWLPK